MAPASDSGNDGSRSLDAAGQKHADAPRDKVLWTSVFVDSVAPFLDFGGLGKFAQTCTTASQIVYDRSSGTKKSILSSLELTLKRHPSLDPDVEDPPQQHVLCAPLLTPTQLNYLDLKRLRVFRVVCVQDLVRDSNHYFGCVDTGTLSFLQCLIDGLGPNVETFSLSVEQTGQKELDDISRAAISQVILRFLLRARDLRTLALPGFVFACKVDDPVFFSSIFCPALQDLSVSFVLNGAAQKLEECISAAISLGHRLLVHVLLPKTKRLAAIISNDNGFGWLETLLPVLSSVEQFSVYAYRFFFDGSVTYWALDEEDIISLRKYVGGADCRLGTFRTVGVGFRGSEMSFEEWSDWVGEMMHPDSPLRRIEFLRRIRIEKHPDPNPPIYFPEIFTKEQQGFFKGLAFGLGKGADLGGFKKFVGDMPRPKKEQ